MCAIRESYVMYDAYIYIYYTLIFLEIVSICIYVHTIHSLGVANLLAPSTVGSDISILLAVNCDVLRWFETTVDLELAVSPRITLRSTEIAIEKSTMKDDIYQQR